MTLRYVVGIKTKNTSDQITVEAEDALIAALIVKTAHPESTITYVRKQNTRGDRRHPHPGQIKESPAEPDVKAVISQGHPIRKPVCTPLRTERRRDCQPILLPWSRVETERVIRGTRHWLFKGGEPGGMPTTQEDGKRSTLPENHDKSDKTEAADRAL